MSEFIFTSGVNFPPKWTNDIKIVIDADIQPSENSELVLQAVKTLFPTLTCQISDSIITGRSEDPKVLYYLCNRIFELQILDAARRSILETLLEYSGEDFPMVVEFFLSKQVALVNKVSFIGPEDATLGPITVKIISSQLKNFLDLFFPKFEWFTESRS